MHGDTGPATAAGESVALHDVAGPVLASAFPGPDIQVIGRCGNILRLFTPARTSLRAADLETILDMQRSTAHRYLTSLATSGFLEQTEDGSYALGPLMSQVGTIALDSQRVLDLADPFLRRLASDVHETAVLSVWGGLGPVVARVVEDMEKVVHIQVRIGTALPADSAQGKVFLAFLDDRDAVARALAHLPSSIAATIDEDVERVRTAGLSIGTTAARGVRTIAAPVLDRRNRLLAAMGVVGTISTIPDTTDSGLARALEDSARELSRQLGWGSRA